MYMECKYEDAYIKHFCNESDDVLSNRCTEIWSIQGKGTAIEVHRKGNFTHTPGTLRTILSGVLNRLAKLTLRRPYFHSERVENV